MTQILIAGAVAAGLLLLARRTGAPETQVGRAAAPSDPGVKTGSVPRPASTQIFGLGPNPTPAPVTQVSGGRFTGGDITYAEPPPYETYPGNVIDVTEPTRPVPGTMAPVETVPVFSPGPVFAPEPLPTPAPAPPPAPGPEEIKVAPPPRAIGFPRMRMMESQLMGNFV